MDAQKALFYTALELSPAIGRRLSADVNDARDRRGEWSRIIRFIVDAGIAPDLRSLSVGLDELGRGVVTPELEVKKGGARGGLGDTGELQLKSFAVECADELRIRCGKLESYKEELRISGTAYSTIEGYKTVVSAGPPEMRPRSSYTLAWGAQPPEIVLQEVIWEIKDRRKRPRNARVVES